jgi:two-component system cell cycle response regulator DivK
MPTMKDAHGIRDEPSILVVDDYEDNRQMYAELLAYAGYRVAEARDGAEAIAMAHRILPDLIVMDLSLPVIDGWEATRRLKADERTRPIPVLALTGHAPEGLAGHSEAARDAGCDAFLAKPCSPETLLQVIQEILLAPRPSARVDAKASPLLDAKASPLLDAKASPLLDAKASPTLDAKAPPTKVRVRPRGARRAG